VILDNLRSNPQVVQKIFLPHPRPGIIYIGVYFDAFILQGDGLPGLARALSARQTERDQGGYEEQLRLF
jgi:hypothetical protein